MKTTMPKITDLPCVSDSDSDSEFFPDEEEDDSLLDNRDYKEFVKQLIPKRKKKKFNIHVL